MVNERVEIERKIAELMSEDFPKLVLQNQVKLAKKGIMLILVQNLQPIKSFIIFEDWNRVVT